MRAQVNFVISELSLCSEPELHSLKRTFGGVEFENNFYICRECPGSLVGGVLDY